MTFQANSITVGVRSDGQLMILSSPTTPGPVAAQAMIFPPDLARWIAHELLRLLDNATPVPPETGGGAG